MSGESLKKITIRNASLANGKRHIAGLVRLFLQENTREGVEGVEEPCDRSRHVLAGSMDPLFHSNEIDVEVLMEGSLRIDSLELIAPWVIN